MKKIFILSGVFMLLASPSAYAQVSVGVNFGVPMEEPVPVPTYIAPAPDWPSYHYDRQRRGHNEYWAHQRRDNRGHR